VAINFPYVLKIEQYKGRAIYVFTFRSNSNEYLTVLPISIKFSRVINHTELPTEISYILAEVILRNILNSVYSMSVSP
jgi:hypothetical protein